MIRTFLAAFFLTGYSLVLGPPLILHAFVTKRADLLYRMGVGGVVFIVKALGARICVEGLEHIPAGACLFVANHTSTADAPAIVGSIPRQIAILAKQSLFRIPIVGQAFRLARFVPVDRSNREASVASVEKAIQRLREGTSFLIYPEGTRSEDGRLQPFKKGAFIMAIKARVPIVPVACAGAHKVMRKRQWKFCPGEIVVQFCPAIESSSYSLQQRDALSATVHASLAAGLPPDQRPL
jgi:1-acyl-sn-glycerol-3-phosphate acyltransferase